MATPPLTLRARRVLDGFVIASAALCVYAQRQVDPDLYGYLAYGRLFVEQGTAKVADPFAYTTAGLQWVSFEYLAQIALWLSYNSFGPAGLIGLKMVLGGAAIGFLWIAIRTTTDDRLHAIPIFLLATTAASRYFIFRPQLVTFACFGLYVAILFRYLLRGRAPLWLLPFVMIPWVNSHGGFLAGLGAVGLACLLCAARSLRATGPLLATFAACAAATFVTPFGAGLWRYVLTEVTHGTNRRYIAEWGPGGLSVDPWSSVLLVVLSAALAAAGWMAHKRAGIIAGIPPWAWACSGVPLLVMASLSVRHVPLAMMWAAPVISLLGAAVGRTTSAHVAGRLGLGIGVAALISLLLTVQFVAARPQPEIARGGALLGSTDPCPSVMFLRDRQIAGNVYAPLWWGAYIAWEAYPNVRVALDGRNISLFTDEMVEANLRFYSQTVTKTDRDEPFRYDTDGLLVPADAAILEFVEADPRWRKVYQDRDAVFFVRGDSGLSPVPSGIATSSDSCPGIFR